jgi:hypothetical protein
MWKDFHGKSVSGAPATWDMPLMYFVVRAHAGEPRSSLGSQECYFPTLGARLTGRPRAEELGYLYCYNNAVGNIELAWDRRKD